MNAILIALMTFAAVSLALYPLFKNEWRTKVPRVVDPTIENLLSQREATYSAIKDLEFDCAQGKLSEADYADLRAKYEAKALTILQQLEGIGQLETRHPSLSAGSVGDCPQCGTSLTVQDRFCRACGYSFAARCSICGTSITEADRFCRQCGALTVVSVPA